MIKDLVGDNGNGTGFYEKTFITLFHTTFLFTYIVPKQAALLILFALLERLFFTNNIPILLCDLATPPSRSESNSPWFESVQDMWLLLPAENSKSHARWLPGLGHKRQCDFCFVQQNGSIWSSELPCKKPKGHSANRKPNSIERPHVGTAFDSPSVAPRR